MKFYIDLGAKVVVLLALLSLLQGEFIMAYVALYIGYWVIIANLLQIKKQGWDIFPPTTINTNIFKDFFYIEKRYVQYFPNIGIIKLQHKQGGI